MYTSVYMEKRQQVSKTIQRIGVIVARYKDWDHLHHNGTREVSGCLGQTRQSCLVKGLHRNLCATVASGICIVVSYYYISLPFFIDIGHKKHRLCNCCETLC